MILIKISKCSVSIEGHAQSNKKGKDLVCAAVSAIALSSLGWFNKKDVDIVIDEKKPLVGIQLINKSEKNKLLLGLMSKQLKAIAKENKKYICLK